MYRDEIMCVFLNAKKKEKKRKSEKTWISKPNLNLEEEKID